MAKLSIWLIYESIPERTDIYFIHSDFLTEEDHKVLDLCHYHYLNMVEDNPEVEQALQTLNMWLSIEENGKYSKFRLEDTITPPTTHHETKVIITGFLM